MGRHPSSTRAPTVASVPEEPDEKAGEVRAREPSAEDRERAGSAGKREHEPGGDPAA